jgi:glycosyltransferase involved in cell wall biosynthesis
MSNGDDKGNDIVLVISRIDPDKKIENAINLAKILKDNNTGKEMKIVGNLYYHYSHYYSELKQMVLDLGLTDYITFEINASLGLCRDHAFDRFSQSFLEVQDKMNIEGI